jgi:protein-S-isoprenylcysteine O-methyltransferase Ste14
MRRLVLAMLAFAGATAVNTASVAVQQRCRLLTRCFGPRGWYVHLALTIPAWLGFLGLLPRLSRAVRWPLPARLRPFGALLLAGSALLWLLAYRELGGARTGNGPWFGHGSAEPVSGGVFRILRNPMYDSYALAFAGAAFYRCNAVYLLLAAESVALFQGLEAHVENRQIESGPRGIAS